MNLPEIEEARRRLVALRRTVLEECHDALIQSGAALDEEADALGVGRLLKETARAKIDAALRLLDAEARETSKMDAMLRVYNEEKARLDAEDAERQAKRDVQRKPALPR